MNKIHMAEVLGRPEFLEASLEELRVLIAVRECGSTDSIALSEICKISLARANAAVSYWKSAGIITDDGTPTITEVFERRIVEGELLETTALQTANDIRDNNLADMIAECAHLMKTDTSKLKGEEIKHLTALYTQYSLSAEFIVNLALYEAERLAKSEKKLTVSKLIDKALKLSAQGIDTAEALSEYIERSKLDSEYRFCFEYRFKFSLSNTAKGFINKWGTEFGYSVKIVEEAFDIATNSMDASKKTTQLQKLKYMDRILTKWHSGGCKTLAECREFNEKGNEEKRRQYMAEKEKESNIPKYGNFDINDAFQRALERSFGEDEE